MRCDRGIQTAPVTPTMIATTDTGDKPVDMFVTTIETSLPATEDNASAAMEALQPWHPAAFRTEAGNGNLSITLTLAGEHLEAATVTAIRLVGEHFPIVSVFVIDEATRDKREGWEPIPELLSVTEVAQRLGITRTAVQKRIDTGSLPARRVGTGWAIPETAVR